MLAIADELFVGRDGCCCDERRVLYKRRRRIGAASQTAFARNAPLGSLNPGMYVNSHAVQHGCYFQCTVLCRMMGKWAYDTMFSYRSKAASRISCREELKHNPKATTQNGGGHLRGPAAGGGANAAAAGCVQGTCSFCHRDKMDACHKPVR